MEPVTGTTSPPWPAPTAAGPVSGRVSVPGSKSVTNRALVLAALGFKFDPGIALPLLMALVAVLTLLSIAFYVAEWVRHVSNGPGR